MAGVAAVAIATATNRDFQLYMFVSPGAYSALQSDNNLFQVGRLINSTIKVGGLERGHLPMRYTVIVVPLEIYRYRRRSVHSHNTLATLRPVDCMRLNLRISGHFALDHQDKHMGVP